MIKFYEALFMKNGYLFLTLLMLSSGSLYAQQLTAEEAIQLGLKNNYDIRIARNLAEIAQKNKSKGTAEFLPTIDATGSYEFLMANQETNSPFSFGESDTRAFNSQLVLSWTLFDGFKMFVTKNRFRELAKLGEYQTRNIIENMVVAILRAYFNLVQQEQLLDVAQRTRDISSTRLEKEKARRDIGGASSTDFLNAQVALNNDQAIVIDLELRVINAKKELNLLLGQQAAAPIVIKKELTVLPLDMTLDELITLSEKRNSEILIAKQNQTLAEQNVRDMKSSFYPRLSLNASYSYTDRLVASDRDNFAEDIETQSRDKRIGLSLRYNLFNGFRDKIDLETARLEVQNQELASQDTHNILTGLVHEKFETLKKRLELIKLEEQNVRAAEQSLELQKDRYQIGTSTSLDFRDAQINLTRAQTLLISARYQARITQLEIQQLSGSLNLESQINIPN